MSVGGEGGRVSNPLLDGFDMLTHGEAADGFVSVNVRALRDLVALARASSAGLEAGRAEQAGKAERTAAEFSDVLKALDETDLEYDAVYQTVKRIMKAYGLGPWKTTAVRALAPEHRPGPAAGGGA